MADCNVLLSSYSLSRESLDSSLREKESRLKGIDHSLLGFPSLDSLQKFVEDCGTYLHLQSDLSSIEGEVTTHREKIKKQKDLVEVCNGLYDLFSRDLLLILLGDTL